MPVKINRSNFAGISSFSLVFLKALKTEKSEEVNKVLGGMEVPAAKYILAKLQIGGDVDVWRNLGRDATKLGGIPDQA